MAVPIPFIEQFERFLVAEQGATGNLVGMYAQTRAELAEFLLHPPIALSASDQAFYGALQTEVDRLSRQATSAAASWVEQSIPTAFVEGARQHSPDMIFSALHDNAVRALSSYNLALITQIDEQMRSMVRQQIGVALLEGATRQQVSDRLVKGGLTNIAHWRSVEERAAVIARTEIMRSYNQGNLAGILDSGAIAVRWITGNDERTCSICGPRHGKKYRAPGMRSWGQNVPPEDIARWRKLDTVDPPPAHPRCRCTIRAFYFDDDVTTPEPLPGGIIEATPAPAGPPPSEFDALFDQTRAKHFPTTDEYNRAGLAWKDAALDDDRLRRIATEFDDDAYRFVVGGRYGVQLQVDSLGSIGGRAAKTWANPEFRFRLLKSIERVRAVTPRYVQGSPYFNRLIITTKSVVRKRGVLADCSPTGVVRINMSSAPEYLKKGIRTNANGIEEILVHEIGHSIHNRWGFAGYGFRGIEDVIDGVFTGAAYERWQAIRAATARAIFEPGKLDMLRARAAMHAARLAEYERAVASFDTLTTVTVTKRRWNSAIGALEDYQVDVRVLTVDGRTHEFTDVLDVDFQRKMAQSALDQVQKELATYEQATDLLPTEYASRGGLKEDFAESLMLYLLDPAALKAASPLRFEYMRDVIFAA